ncbi:MAG TPA: hypothetical protein VHB21_00345 [Minicystis sp.]|nr:hypothetical protein [Minicystis sp.]
MKLRELLRILADHGVRFAVVGGVALIARGGQRTTEDLDVAYARDRDNLKHLADALAPIHPRLRGVPSDLPFVFDDVTLRNGLNFTLDTDLGPIDLLGEVAGLGGFDQVDAASSELEIAGARMLVLTLDGLERAKRAAGRPKDLFDLGTIRALKAEESPRS